MRLEGKQIDFISCVTHDGKVVMLGLGKSGELHYTIRQTGFEDSALNGDNDTGFEQWKKLSLDLAHPDPSVLAHEQKQFNTENGQALITSRYGAPPETVQSA